MSHRIYLVELEYLALLIDTTDVIETFRLTNVSGYLDDSGVKYSAGIVSLFNFESSIFGDGKTSGASKTGVGTIEVSNLGGQYDYFNRMGFDGRRVRILVGNSDQPSSTFKVLFTGTIEAVTVSIDKLTFHVRDNSLLLEKAECQPNTYAGTNTGTPPSGKEGTADDIKGNQKPIVAGDVYSMTPVLVNSSLLVYQVHDGAVFDIPTVYDSGVQLGESIIKNGTFDTGLEEWAVTNGGALEYDPVGKRVYGYSTDMDRLVQSVWLEAGALYRLQASFTVSSPAQFNNLTIRITRYGVTYLTILTMTGTPTNVDVVFTAPSGTYDGNAKLMFEFTCGGAQYLDNVILTPSVFDVENLAALEAAVISPGSYVKCNAEGLFRLGAYPYGSVTADVRGGLRCSNQLFVNSSFDSWSGGNPVSWVVENESANGDITDGGGGTCRIRHVNSSGACTIAQTIECQEGYVIEVTVNISSYTSGQLRVVIVDPDANVTTYAVAGATATGTFTQKHTIPVGAIENTTKKGTWTVKIGAVLGAVADFKISYAHCFVATGSTGDGNTMYDILKKLIFHSDMNWDGHYFDDTALSALPSYPMGIFIPSGSKLDVALDSIFSPIWWYHFDRQYGRLTGGEFAIPTSGVSAGIVATLVDDDFEASAGSWVADGKAPTWSTGQYHSGAKSIKHDLSYTDSPVNSKCMAKSDTFIVIEEGKEYTCDFWVYLLDPNWGDDDSAEIIAQIHSRPDTTKYDTNPLSDRYGQLETWRNPPVGLKIQNSQWRLHIRATSDEVTPMFSGDWYYTDEVEYTGLGAIVTNTWINWRFEWKHTYKSDGYFRAYLDGVLVVNHVGPTTQNDLNGAFFSFGVYKWDWATGPTDVSRRVLYVDDVEINEVASPTLTIDTNIKVVKDSLTVLPLRDDNKGIPPYKIILNYYKNWSPVNEKALSNEYVSGEVVGVVTDARRAWMTKEFRAVVEDTYGKDGELYDFRNWFKTSSTLTFNCLLIDEADADTVVDALATIHKATIAVPDPINLTWPLQRFRYEMQIPAEVLIDTTGAGLKVSLGDTVFLTGSRFFSDLLVNRSTGMYGIVIGITEVYGRHSGVDLIKLTVVG